MDIRISVQPDGSVFYFAYDSIKEEYYRLDPEYAAAIINGEEGTDKLDSIVVAGKKYEFYGTIIDMEI